jgi:three-Cys-motif partner protein
MNWSNNRAVVFLDPYGMQVDWATLEAIARTKAVDLWDLFPVGVGVNRMLTQGKKPPDPWARTLTRVLGTDWEDAFYSERSEPTLFGDESITEKRASFEAIATFFNERLKSIFARVARNPLWLENSTHSPIYLLCFAASGNARVARLAVKIAEDILGKL